MSKRVQVVLNKPVNKLGKNGDLVEVAHGYARNYLIPQGMGVLATPGILRQVEQRRAEGGFNRGTGCQHTPGRHRKNGEGQPAQIGADLAVLQDRAGIAADKLDVADIGKAAQDHEQRPRIFPCPDIVAKGIVPGRKPARRDRGHGMNGGIKRGHANRKIGQGADEGQRRIDPQKIKRDIRGPWHHLAHGIEAFGPEELHAAHPHDRQKDHRDNGNTQAAQPVQHPPPQVDAGGQVIQPDQHGGPGGGNPRHRLEIGIDEP